MDHVERNAPFQRCVDNTVCLCSTDRVQAIADQDNDATFRANARQIVKRFDCLCGCIEDGSLLIRRGHKVKSCARGIQIFCEWSYERGSVRKTKNCDAGP